MQKSFVVKSPINFADFGFFVRVGDILVHDTSNGNKLTVYRSGEIVKAITQTALGMAALLKQEFITELVAAQPAAAVPTPPKPVEATKKVAPAPSVVAPSQAEIDGLKQQKEAILLKEKRKAKAVAQEDSAEVEPKADTKDETV